MLSVVGVPSSAASYASGQEQAPAALRAAGLIAALQATAGSVHDDGDLPVQTCRPDRERPLAQNVEQVVRNIRDVADRVERLLPVSDALLVLGGNCAVALGVLAGLRRVTSEASGLLYVDRGFDLNTPHSTTDGALDWMGMAPALDLPGVLGSTTEDGRVTG